MSAQDQQNTSLVADALKNDPRVQEAKRLLTEAVREHSSKLNAVTPANPALKLKYKQMLEELAAGRGGATFFPYLSSGLGMGLS